MSDWLVVMTEDNWEICVEHRLLALTLRAQRGLASMQEDDKVWVYINRKRVDRQTPNVRRLRAVVRVKGPVRRLDASPWKPRNKETFSLAREIVVERQFDVPADVLIRLIFAGPSPRWGTNLLNAPLRLTPYDVQQLEECSRAPEAK